MDSKIYKVMNFAKQHKLTLQTAVIVMAAEERGIPWFHVPRPWRVAIGGGPNRVWFNDSRTTKIKRTSLIVSWNKHKTTKRLAKWGVPVPRHFRVRSEVEAAEAADQIGFPVVVKPLCGSQGQGVSVKLTSRGEVERAYRRAVHYNKTVIVEKYLEGNDYRLLVVGNKLVAVAHRLRAQVIGDGKSSIGKLIKITNADIRRSWGQRNILSKIHVNDDLRRMLRLGGYTLKSVPKKGSVVVLRSVANVSAGGYSIEVTDKVHPDNRALAIRASKKVGLRVAGVDFICPDISKSYKENGGGIIEINGTPGLRIHLTPREGKVQDIGGEIVNLLFPRKTVVVKEAMQESVLKWYAPIPDSAGIAVQAVM